MEKSEYLKTIILVAIVFMLIGGGYIALKNASGVNPPSTVIESESMQHSNQSQIGIIDTGDLIIVKSPSNTEITTYVTGFQKNYSTFGDFGSVIVYKRAIGNPVIHRAIVYLHYDSVTDRWSSPELENYPEEYWNCNGNHDYNNLSGTLTITKPGSLNQTVSITITALEKKSGYVTMGDNNSICDQSCAISQNILISKERIKSIAWLEIPWIGAIKMVSSGHMNQVMNKVPNTIPNLIAFFSTMILVVFSIGFVYDSLVLRKMKNRN